MPQERGSSAGATRDAERRRQSCVGAAAVAAGRAAQRGGGHLARFGHRRAVLLGERAQHPHPRGKVNSESQAETRLTAAAALPEASQRSLFHADECLIETTLTHRASHCHRRHLLLPSSELGWFTSCQSP